MLHSPARLRRSLGILASVAMICGAPGSASLQAIAPSPREISKSSNPSRTDASPISQRANELAASAVLGAIAQSPLQAVEPTLVSAENKAQLLKTGSLFSRPAPVEVLMIGDSMTVGGFGEELLRYLFRRYGSTRVALYASCGSSPEHWLKDEPTYYTKCGYREQTPLRHIYYDFENHRPPPATPTPKLENLLALHQPNLLIIQMGTNWMDRLESKPFAAEKAKYAAILDRVAEAIRRSSKTPPKVIWITPPDSSRYAGDVERNVDYLITSAAKRHKFQVIDSSSMTHYIAGRTGGDGVHYKDEYAFAWARNVQSKLDKLR